MIDASTSVAGSNGAGCGYPGAPAHSSVRFTGTDVDDVLDEEDALLEDTTLPEGTVATYSCERGFELLGPTRRECQDNGMWMPEGVPFCGKSSVHVLAIFSRYPYIRPSYRRISAHEKKKIPN